MVSRTRKGDNWLSNTKDGVCATSILIRESFMDWENEVGSTWSIERVDTRGVRSPVRDQALVDQQYARAAAYLTASTRGWVDFVAGLAGKLRPGIMSPPREGDDALPGQRNSAGIFELGPDQAVIIRLAKSPARYQSIQVGDLWFNSFDYCRRQTSLTLAQARPSSDGYYRVVISHKDPGVENWLDPSGASTTFVFARWQGLESDYTFAPGDEPCAMVVDFDALRDHFPPDEPHFSACERAAQLAARKAASLMNPRRF